MEITCPECGARYEVGATIVPPGRKVRCARCDAAWVPVPEIPAKTQPEPAIPEAVPPPTPVAGPRPFLPPIPNSESGTAPPRRSTTLVLAWAASIVSVAFVLWAFLHFRHAVAAAWPPAGRLYGWLGLPFRR